jgi:hypothetical protein
LFIKIDIRKVIILIIITIFSIYLFPLIDKDYYQENYYVNNKKFIKYINKKYNYDKLLIVGYYDPQYGDLFKIDNLFKNKELIILELAQYSGSKNLEIILKENANCLLNDFVCRFEYLLKNKESILIFGNENRLNLYKSYLKIVYNYNFNFEIVEQNNGLNVKVFKIK